MLKVQEQNKYTVDAVDNLDILSLQFFQLFS